MSKTHKKGYIVVRRKNVHGGFLPTALITGHEALKQIKPISNAINVAKELGIADPINNFLESNTVGRAIKSVGSFLKNTLGYGSKRRKKPVRRRKILKRRKT